MQVELDIMSGRPNPVWDLTPAQADELGDIVETLPTGTGTPPPDPGLGYRGFVVTDKARPSWRLGVFKGFVRISGGGPTEIRNDRDRRLERWLLDSAGTLLGDQIRRRVPLE
ncbi:hypothetical protein [Sinorhizobium sp. BG8]|uniref:hypothetical protein n=1 Tax=Sinorhizobium sp. BG8 TaxID=2613773 RepID=UPI00193D53F1|nr:hypothetical protein [Sinorhizobium sp. BG8]QRM54929.1 hypothetical protein F3Y30_10525 [Sinorhizobium sp. BG8]